MKYIVILLLLSTFNSKAQKTKTKESFYIFKSDWSPAKRTEDAAYFARMSKLSDTCWQWDVYNFMGPLIKSERYLDDKLTTLHGRQHYFKPSGRMDSSGYVFNNVQHGDWSFLNDSSVVVMKKQYEHGVLTRTIDMLKDTTEDTKDSTDHLEVASSFPGRLEGWQKYLLKNLRYPDRALKAGVKGEVVVQFVIGTDGQTSEPEIFRSVEYSIDSETIRLIKNSPKWNPAKRDGKPIKSYKRQPLIFSF